ncbi:MAG: hypothetical protein ACXIT4_11005 [Erythrobacter sp.]
MAIPAFLISEEPAELRGAERWRVRLGARWVDSGPAAQSLTILDLSSSGFLMETDQPIKTGASLIVEMSDEVTKTCQTVWNSGKLHGATFLEPLSDVELQGLINSAKVVWPSFGARKEVGSTGKSSNHPPVNFDSLRIDAENKRPAAVGLLMVFGTSAALWALIGLGIWLTIK